MSENKDLAERFRAFMAAWNQRRDAGDLIYSYGTMEGPEDARRERIHTIAADDLVRAAAALESAPECTCAWYGQSAGGGYVEMLADPDPGCLVHFPNGANVCVAVDDVARVIDPQNWALSDAPQYAHLPEEARDGLRRNSREAATRVQALLAHRKEAATVTPGMVAAFKGAWNAADARGEKGGRVRAGLAAALAMDPGEDGPCPHEAWLVDTTGRPVRCADCGDPLPEDHEVTEQRVKREADIQHVVGSLREQVDSRSSTAYLPDPGVVGDRGELRSMQRRTAQELRDLRQKVSRLVVLLDQGAQA